MERSQEAGGGTEGSNVTSGTLASASKDRGSSEDEGTVDSIRLVVTSGKSKGEGSRASGRPGEAAFLLRKAVRRVWSLRRVEGDLVFLWTTAKQDNLVGLNQLTILSGQGHISEFIGQTHKVILASSSPSIENLWKRNKYAHPLIYMREIADDQKITEMLAHQRGRSSF